MTAPTRRRGAPSPSRLAVTSMLAALLVAAGCTAGDPSAGSPSTRSGDDGAPRAAAVCDQGAASDEAKATPVDGVPTDITVTSADGTEIRAHWFPVEGAGADRPAPTILMGPGWSFPGDTNLEGGSLFGALSINGMHAAGYNVLTWDPRGSATRRGPCRSMRPTPRGRTSGRSSTGWPSSRRRPPTAPVIRASGWSASPTAVVSS